MLMRECPNLVNQLTTPKYLYQTITQTLDQPLYGYRCVIYICAAPMCCHGVCVQGLYSTGHLQNPTQELAIRVTALTPTSWHSALIASTKLAHDLFPGVIANNLASIAAVDIPNS